MNLKEKKYGTVLGAVESLIEGEGDLISVMSTVSCELYHAFEAFNWVGFYRMVDDSTLKVGPYQGSHGCLTIDIERGVCGKCVREAAVQLENNVNRLPFHIACSSETVAEIVLPVIDGAGRVRAVLDVDSVQADVFDETDVTYLMRLCSLVSERCTASKAGTNRQNDLKAE